MEKRAPQAHRIGRAGRRLFGSLMPSEWPIHEEDGDDDYGIDATVEIIDGERPTGLRCLVQLKSTEDARIRANTVSVRLDTADVQYLLSKQLATFLVCVDLEGGEFYWVEVHEYFRAKSASEGKAWQDQETLTVSIPRRHTSEAVRTTWPTLARDAPGMISIAQHGLPPYRKFREAAGLAAERPEAIRAAQAQVKGLQSGLDVDQAIRLQLAGDDHGAQGALADAIRNAVESGDPERIVEAAKLFVASGRPMNMEENLRLFEVAGLGAEAAEKAGLKGDAAYLFGMEAIIAAHRFLDRLANAQIQARMAKDADGLTQWVAGQALAEHRRHLAAALEQAFQAIEDCEREGNYVLMSQLLRSTAILEAMTCDFGDGLHLGEPAGLKDVTVGHLELAVAIGRALKNEDIVIHGLLDLAVTQYKWDAKDKAAANLAEAQRLNDATADPGRSQPRIDIIRGIMPRPPPTIPTGEPSEEEKDRLLRGFAKRSGYNVDDPKNNIDWIVAVGLKDRNPERALKWCAHLETAPLGPGIPGRLLGLPAAGMKILHCSAKPHTIAGMQLDLLLQSFQEGPCVGCPMRTLRPPEWRWSEQWARETPPSESMRKAASAFRCRH